MTMMEGRIAMVAVRAMPVFGWDETAMMSWLKNPEEAFDGKTPVCLLTTDYGYAQVLDFLAQLGQGLRLAA